MDIELEKLNKLEYALHDAIDILRDWQVEEVKQEEERFIAYLARPKYRDCYLTACAENMWEAVQKEFDAKTKLFVGTCDEAVKWYESREKFTEIIKAWEDGKTIQVYETLFKKWSDCAGTLEWYTDCEYRVKPDCPCEEGIDSKACAGCPQDEWRIVNEAWNNAIGEEKESFSPSLIERVKKLKNQEKTLQKKERPFKDCDELVEFWSKNYQTGFRPAYTKPLIWVRLKCDGRERLIVAFGTDFVEIGNKAKAVPLQKLFDDYEFLDGCVIGVKKDMTEAVYAWKEIVLSKEVAE